MNHLLFLLLLISIVCTGAWITTTIFLYFNSRKSLLIWESLVGFSLASITTGLLLFYYGINCGLQTGIFPTGISFIGTLSIITVLPFFTMNYLCIPVKRRQVFLFVSVALVYSSAIFLLFSKQAMDFKLVGPFGGTAPDSTILVLFVFYGILFYGTLGYNFVLGILKGRTIGEKSLQRMRVGTFGSALFFLPFLVVFSLLGNQQVAVICLALMFSTISIINNYFSILYASQPVYLRKNELTESFSERFEISKREKDVLALLLNGLANKEIADKLAISVRTVENHLSSIYQKTETNSRIQVINLIRANSN
jgi:DNA-binding CsgD family transcriptional regulator